MKNYEFSVVPTASELTDDACEALYEAGCDDGTIVTRNRVTHIAFDRSATSLEEALRSAIENVQAAGFQVARVQLEPEGLVKI